MQKSNATILSLHSLKFANAVFSIKTPLNLARNSSNNQAFMAIYHYFTLRLWQF